MTQIRFAAVSRNYFNMPVWIGADQGFFRDEGIDLAVELHEGVDEVSNRLADGRAARLWDYRARDPGQPDRQEKRNHRRLLFFLAAGKGIRAFEDMRGKVVGVSSLEAGSSSLIMELFEAHGLHRRTRAADYINRTYLNQARSDLARAG